MLLVMCSCTKGGSDLNIEISPPDKSLVDLASKIYDETELLELTKFNGSLNELNIKYPIECLREDNGMYRVSYLGDGSIAIFLLRYSPICLNNALSFALLFRDASTISLKAVFI